MPEALESRTLLSAEFVADLNPYTAESDPQQFVNLGDQAYFVARTGPADVFGLFRTDGTAAGTALVADGLSSPKGLTAAAGKLYFWASDTDHGEEVWTSDGTAAGTGLMCDTVPGPAAGRPFRTAIPADQEFVEFGGRVYFSQALGQLWVTDGTPAGTKHFEGSNSFGEPWDFAVVGDRLYYIQNTTSAGDAGVWKTDGTPDGTTLVRRYVNCGTDLNHLTDVNGTLYFASPGISGVDLWKSDGSTDGTVLVKGSATTAGVTEPADLVASGNTLLFTAYAPGFGGGPRVLWKSDGTAEGTVPVATGAAAPLYASRLVASPAGGVLFAAAAAAPNPGQPPDYEIWNSDGTAAGTVELKDVFPGRISSLAVGVNFPEPRNLVFQRVGSTVYFAADDGVSGRELWKTDGTPAGTVLAADVRQGFRPSNPGGVPMFPGSKVQPEPRAFGTVNGKLIFSAAGDSDDFEPWVSDGTAGGTQRLADLNRTPLDSNPRNLANFNGSLLVAADLGSIERRLFRSDGTAAGTVTLSDVAPALLPPVPPPDGGFAVVGGVAYYVGIPAGDSASSTSHNYLLYHTDGTPGGTVVVPALSARGGSPPFPPQAPIAGATSGAGTAAYFVALSLNNPIDYGLWRADPSEPGPTLIVESGQFGSVPRFDASYTRLTPVGNLVYFFAPETGGSALWRTDGTPDGTFELIPGSQLFPFPASTSLCVDGGQLFIGTPGGLMVTDGTAAGTRLVGNYVASEMVSFNGAVYFSDTDSLWRTDGTADGTTVVKTIPRPRNLNYTDGLSVVGNSVYFWADDGVHGYEPWVSDGTEAGTHLVTDLNPGPAGSRGQHSGAFPAIPAFAGGRNRAYFAADDGTHGLELWSTDGTAAGTTLEGDINPGPAGSNPDLPVVVNGEALFAATDPVHGRELWKVRLPAAVAARHVFYNNSAFDAHGVSAADADDAAIDPTKAVLLPGHTAGPSNRSGCTKGINGLMVDVAGLPAGASLDANDFSFRTRLPDGRWIDGPRPSEISVRRGAGTSGTDRVTLIWADSNPRSGAPDAAVADGWLEVTVNADARTGLAAPDVFYFGNLRGDTGGGAAGAAVDAVDLARTRAALGSGAAVGTAADVNGDGVVNVLDLAAVRAAFAKTLADPQAQQAARAPGSPGSPTPTVSPGVAYESPLPLRRRAAYEIL